MTTTAEHTAALREARFVSPEQLTIANAAVLYHELDELLGQVEVLDVDLAHVERIDAAGVQLLLAATRRAADRRIEVRWTDPQHRLAAAIAALGLTKAFALAEDEDRFRSDASQPGEE